MESAALAPINKKLFSTDNEVFFDPSPPLGPIDIFPRSERQSYFTPQTRDELVALVKGVASTAKGSGPSRHIRVVGSGHSWSAVAQSGDLLVSLSKYKVSG